jgi:hypothetical protein
VTARVQGGPSLYLLRRGHYPNAACNKAAGTTLAITGKQQNQVFDKGADLRLFSPETCADLHGCTKLILSHVTRKTDPTVSRAATSRKFRARLMRMRNALFQGGIQLPGPICRATRVARLSEAAACGTIRAGSMTSSSYGVKSGLSRNQMTSRAERYSQFG